MTGWGVCFNTVLLQYYNIKVSLKQICYIKLACKALGVFCNANDDILGANASAILDVDIDRVKVGVSQK